ncbi:MAG: GIY-YIG nuclease family protein [Lysobacter sp.]|nr:GIY-YIG nuclease family protein [Lysobacter sp.]
MLNELQYHVYIMSSRSRAIYIGVTSNLMQGVASHRSGAISGHTRRYRITRLVYFEATNDIHAAIAREKQLKGWRREKKVRLIESCNPTWEDLAEDWLVAPTSDRSPSPESQTEGHS